MASNTLRVLTRRSDFNNLKLRGRRVRPSDWMLINYKTNSTGQIRCGWTISRKVGNAVTRNKLKRWCRESFRKIVKREESQSIDINIVINSGKDAEFFKRIKYSDFQDTLERGLRKILS